MRRTMIIAAALVAIAALSCSRAAGDWVLDEEATKGLGGLLTSALALEPELSLLPDGTYTLRARGKDLGSGKWERSGDLVRLEGFGDATFTGDRITLKLAGQTFVLRRK